MRELCRIVRHLQWRRASDTKLKADAPHCNSGYPNRGLAVNHRIINAGWSWGCVSAVDSTGRTIWIADAYRDAKRFVVRADEKLTAFMELESAIRPRDELA